MKVVRAYSEAKGMIAKHRQEVQAKDKGLVCDVDTSHDREVRLLCYKTAQRNVRKRRYEKTVGYEEHD